MSVTGLTLPVDIPWKRLCVSKDMIDTELCDPDKSRRWRSSMAIFSYEPPEEHQTYEDQTITYLKIAFSITGYQPDGDEVGLGGRRAESYWHGGDVIRDYTNVVSAYYGSYGAILEVTVAPEDEEGTSLDDYPYLADFEPKKREIYEMVSETGETMSRSLEDVNVMKGTTTSRSHEEVDIYGGAQGQATSPFGGGGFGYQGQWGSRDLTSQEIASVRTIDHAREMRELFSHTTQLTQMYHQLISYHVGTNRGMFVLFPRPHIVQTEKTFVNGPRLLEGIQEIFLVVARPKTAGRFCVEARLETAHIIQEPIHEHETSTGRLTLHVESRAYEVDLEGADDTKEFPAEASETYTPPPGWEVDVDRDGGYKIDQVSGERYVEAKVTSVAPDHVTAYGKVVAKYRDDTWPDPNETLNAHLDMAVTIYIRKIEPKVVGYNQSLMLTGRGLCCCPRRLIGRPTFDRPWVVFETPLDRALPRIGGDGMDIRDANRLRSAIGHEVLRSMNSPERYPDGKVGFAESKTLGRIMARILRRPGHVDNVLVHEIRGLSASIASQVARVAPTISRGRLLSMGLDELADRFDLELDQAKHLRRAALGLTADEPPRPDRWKRPQRHGEAPTAAD